MLTLVVKPAQSRGRTTRVAGRSAQASGTLSAVWWRRGSRRPGSTDPGPAGSQRADWRLLLPFQPAHRVALIGLGPVDDWRWLVDDGWTDELTTDLSPAAGSPIEAVVLGPPARGDVEASLGPAVEALAPGGALVVLGGAHRRVVRTLRRSGLTGVRRYLAVPDARNPTRLVPLDHPGGLAWLAGPDPALAEARLPARRRLLGRALRRFGAVVPELLGQVVVVASRAGDDGRPPRPLAARLLDPDPDPDPDHDDDAILLTSGFDDGSRSVVLPLADGEPARSGRPRAVVKVVARPAYRDNATREQELLTRLAPEVAPPGLVPTPLGSIDGDGPTAVVESYAGRWTAAAVLNEQRAIDQRAALLGRVMTSITSLARTGIRNEVWNDDGFQDLIGTWFDRLDRLEGPAPDRADLRSQLRARSDALMGRPLPVGLRHFDLGPWNVVLADRDQASPATAPVTIVDWELADQRADASGPAGADHLYFAKYWLHIVLGCRSVDDELEAFAHLASPGSGVPGDDPRALARRAVLWAADDLGLDPGFLPLLEAHVWSEAACHQANRRHPDGGAPARYLASLARGRASLLASWPLGG